MTLFLCDPHRYFIRERSASPCPQPFHVNVLWIIYLLSSLPFSLPLSLSFLLSYTNQRLFSLGTFFDLQANFSRGWGFSVTHCAHIKLSLGQQTTVALVLHVCLVITCQTEKDAEVYLNVEHKHPYCNSNFLPLNQVSAIVQDLLVCCPVLVGIFQSSHHFLSYSDV